MALSLDPATKVITIPQADLTLVSGTLYELDTNQFRLDVIALLDDEAYMWMPDAFIHNTEVTVAGTTFARTIEMINGYSITFENNVYSVRLAGSNNNLFDIASGILNPSGNVTVIAQNSAGLVATPAADAVAVWGALLADHTTANTFGWFIQRLLTLGKWLGLRGGPG